MRIRYETALVQEAVFQESLHNPAFRSRLREVLEPVYELPEGEREGGLVRAYHSLFQERGLGAEVEAGLARFRELEGLEEALVFRALKTANEGAELSRDRCRLGLRLRVGRLSSPRPLLNHELRHIADMLDPTFDYPIPEALGDPIPTYGLLWDVYVDGRLTRSGLETVASREERLRDFDRAFSFLPLEGRRAGFAWLWGAEGLTHGLLEEICLKPDKMLERAPQAWEGERGPLPGSPCPLCAFPTFTWADLASPHGQPLVRLVQADFPLWQVSQGICDRCAQLYQLRAGVW